MASITVTKKKQKQKIKEPQIKITWKEIKRQKVLLIWSAIIVVYGVIFCYLPLGGWLMAFQNYKPKDGLLHSSFVGLAKFQQLFSDATFLRVIRNTLAMGVINLVVTFVMAIVFAILLNEVKSQGGKKVVQTISYLPHFLSWVIVGSVAYQMFRPTTGMVNVFLMNAGIIQNGIPFLTEKWHWAVTYLLIGVWQGMGWGTVIYLAAITGISGELYEAAMIDGANRWQRMWNITLPGIRGTVVTLLIMNLGKVMGSNYERLDQFGNTQVKDFSYQLAIYIYDKGLASAKFSMATAVGIFQSLVGLVLVLLSDRIAKMLGEEGLL